MSNKTEDLVSKPLRLNKPFIDSRGNLYLAKDYAPNELPIQVIEKGHVSIIPDFESDFPSLSEFKVVNNLVPEQKVEIKTRSLNNKKKNPPKPNEVIDLNPIEAKDPVVRN